MIGMSVGSALGGRWTDRTAHPLRLYAAAEGAIGAYCLAFPAVFPALQALYLDLAPPIEGPAGPRNLVRFLLGVAAFVVPSFFMGITTPAYTKALAAGRADMGAAWRGSTLSTCSALRRAPSSPRTFSSRGSASWGRSPSAPRSTRESASSRWRLSRPVEVEARAAAPAPAPDRAIPARRVAALLLVALASGFLSFALEIIWTHLLAILIGNSVYAFGLMLGGLLLGLALGARLAESLRGARGARLGGDRGQPDAGGVSRCWRRSESGTASPASSCSSPARPRASS